MTTQSDYAIELPVAVREYDGGRFYLVDASGNTITEITPALQHRAWGASREDRRAIAEEIARALAATAAAKGRG